MSNGCQYFYALALETELTGDDTKWPDVLAYRWPVDDLCEMTRIFGLDSDLSATVVQVVSSLKSMQEDAAVLRSVLDAALGEQANRRASSA